MSSWSTAVLQAVVSDRRARVFNRSGATAAVTLDISKTFDLTNASHGFSGWLFEHMLSILSNWPFFMVLDGMPLQEYPVNDGVHQGSIFVPTLATKH